MQVMNKEIRDTDPHTSTVLKIYDLLKLNVLLQRITIYWDNNLNQGVSLLIQGSPNGTKWFDIGAVISVAAGGGLNPEDYAVLNEMHNHLRIIATCTVQPATGALKLWIEMN